MFFPSSFQSMISHFHCSLCLLLSSFLNYWFSVWLVYYQFDIKKSCVERKWLNSSAATRHFFEAFAHIWKWPTHTHIVHEFHVLYIDGAYKCICVCCLFLVSSQSLNFLLISFFIYFSFVLFLEVWNRVDLISVSNRFESIMQHFVCNSNFAQFS